MKMEGFKQGISALGAKIENFGKNIKNVVTWLGHNIKNLKGNLSSTVGKEKASTSPTNATVSKVDNFVKDKSPHIPPDGPLPPTPQRTASPPPQPAMTGRTIPNDAAQKVAKKAPLSRTMESQYLTALTAKNLDTSEFTLLALGYVDQKLQQKPDPSVQQELSELKNKVISSPGSKTAAEVLQFCKKHPDLVDTTVLQVLEAKLPLLKDNPNADHNRRFFETRLGANLGSEVERSRRFESVKELTKAMQGFRGGLTETQQAALDSLSRLPISTSGDAEAVLRFIPQFNDNIEMRLKAGSQIYGKKDRQQKTEEKKVEGQEVTQAPTTFSRNLGIMKETTPNFGDLISPDNIENRVVDRYRAGGVEGGFSATHGEVPFVNSVSGTAFTFTMLLLEYVEANRYQPNTQTTVDNLVLAFTARLINHGFHSLSEMQSVLSEPHIQEFFSSRGVVINFTMPPSVVDATFKDAEAYTLTTCLKKAMQTELKSTLPETPAVSPKSPLSAYLGVENATPTRYPDRPDRLYIKFTNAQDKEKAYQKLIEQFGEGACRIATVGDQIEILNVGARGQVYHLISEGGKS